MRVVLVRALLVLGAAVPIAAGVAVPAVNAAAAPAAHVQVAAIEKLPATWYHT